MQIAKKLMMISLAVSDMPKAKAFYTETLGLEVKMDYRQDDDNWWVELVLPEGGVHITLSTHHGNMKPGAVVLYFATSDIDAAHKELEDKSVKVSAIGDDLHGPGSGTKWFNFNDPDGNLVHIEQV
jgi:catechol 2,3-dioxygenase-like lactoylglutathione lyase family enzyme